MHENLLDTIEKPTATSRDFAWFVAKWSVIWAIGMLILGIFIEKSGIYGIPSQIISLIVYPYVLSYLTLSNAIRTLQCDFKHKIYTLFAILSGIIYIGNLLRRIMTMLIIVYYNPNLPIYKSSDICATPFIALVTSAIHLFFSVSVLLFFYKKLKKEQAE
jgi:hypothetical protein